MKTLLTIIVIASVMLAIGIPAKANLTTYTGTLTTPDGAFGGLMGGGAWTTGTSLTWTVDLDGNLWHYHYVLTVPSKNVSHMIIETSADLAHEEILDPVPDIFDNDPQTYSSTSQGGSNPLMPAPIYGIKVTGGSTTVTLDFYSRRNPVWGDFYAVNGKPPEQPIPVVWNAGLTVPDVDPTDPPANGSVDYHLLVPDTTIIPAPGAILLAGIGVGLVGWLRRRRKF